MAVHHLTDQNFASVLQPAALAVVDFTNADCGPCRAIAPYIEQLAAKRPDVLVAKVDTHQARVATMALGVRSTPTVVVLRFGQEVDRKVGSAAIMNLIMPMMNGR